MLTRVSEVIPFCWPWANYQNCCWPRPYHQSRYVHYIVRRTKGVLHYPLRAVSNDGRWRCSPTHQEQQSIL